MYHARLLNRNERSPVMIDISSLANIEIVDMIILNDESESTGDTSDVNFSLSEHEIELFRNFDKAFRDLVS